MSDRPTRWLAPAKLNLFLHILGRREDGYHELQTVFQLLDLCDEIAIRCRSDGRIVRAVGVDDVAESDDLTMRAARALQQQSGTSLGAEITLCKRVPVGAGLGGGSSDCATVLLALDRLWRLGLGEDELAALGRDLGADVPVFVRGRSAWGEGVGERLTPLTLGDSWFLVVVPDCAVSTAAVFGSAALTRNSAPMKIPDCLGGAGNAGRHGADILHLLEKTRNDCEPLVSARYPAVRAALQWAGRAGPARLTGTGAAVFTPLESEELARDWVRRAPPGWRVFAARGLNESPTLAQLERVRV